MKNILVVMFSFVLPGFAFSQNDTGANTVQVRETVKPISIMLDGSSIISSGFGAKATYAINEHLAVGVMGGFLKYRPSEDDETSVLYKYDYTHEIKEGGLVADGFLLTANPRSKFYLSVGVRYAELTTKVQDSFFGTTNVSSSNRTGGILTAGWQYAETLSFLENTGVVFQVGLGFGNAGRIRWAYSGTKTEIEDGFLVDLKAGLQF